MAKFRFEFETEEYSEHLKVSCALQAYALLHITTVKLEQIPDASSLSPEQVCHIAQAVQEIDKFLNLVS